MFDYLIFFLNCKLKYRNDQSLKTVAKHIQIFFLCLTFSSNDSDAYKDQISVLQNEQDLMREEAQKMSSLLPTMWLGAQNGW